MSILNVPPPPLSSQSLADLFCTIIILCRGKDTGGKSFWAYLCIKPSMAETFKEARDSRVFNLEEYGTILESGEGDDVPPDVRARMERDYGVNHHYENDLLLALEGMQDATA